ncbi:MAG: SH3 domain-containing protein, partial [Anaerolineae bacterium]|nr:SH3 domain-containing protein [Anaerolineae bacterium]
MMIVFVSAVAQQDECPALVEQALTNLGQNCDALDRNSACYGYNKLSATFNEEQPDDYFSKVSDRTSLNVLDTLSTTPLDAAAGTWGVAVMKVQANVPNSLPGQAVTFVLLGDTQIRNDVSPADAFTPAEPVDVTAVGNVNIRSSASTRANVIGSVTAETVLPADGISENGNWYRVLYNDSPAWINADFVTAPDAANALPVITQDLRTPMQA